LSGVIPPVETYELTFTISRTLITLSGREEMYRDGSTLVWCPKRRDHWMLEEILQGNKIKIDSPKESFKRNY
jgi:hypothetical protein